LKVIDQHIPEGHNAVNFFVIVKGGAAGFIEFVEKVLDGRENKQLRTPDKDGTLIHAEIQVGDSTILVADSKGDWPFTPAFPQVYVTDAQEVLRRAEKAGAIIVTEVSAFHGGLLLARFQDPWDNIWWLFQQDTQVEKYQAKSEANVDWHNSKPSHIYTTLMETMRQLRSRVS
jgi:uncharacterized glyoxalase superfamily protein PhnB